MFHSVPAVIPDARQFPRADRVRQVDLAAVHVFALDRHQWLRALAFAVQSLLLISAGTFLLLQITTTPKLAVQIALTALLLLLGGAAMMYRAAELFRSELRIDRSGVSIRADGQAAFAPWSQIEMWRVDDPQQPQWAAVTFWLSDEGPAIFITGTQADAETRFAIRHVLRAFAGAKERTQAAVL